MKEPVLGARRILNALTPHGLIAFEFLLFVAVLACLMPAQSDTFWQLRAGQEMVRSGRVMMTDRFSHTAFGAFWPNHQWLGEVVLFGAHWLGRMPLVALTCGICAFGSFLFFWSLVRARPEDRLLLAALTMPLVLPAWSLRSQVFSLAGFALTVSLVRAERLWLIPLLFVVWANLHGGVALGFVVLAADALVEATTGRRGVWRRVAVLAASAAATVVTPLGTRYWPEIVAIIDRSRVNAVPEWQAPGLGPESWLFWALAGVFAATLVMRFRRLLSREDRFLAVLGLLLLPLAIRASRNITPFALVGMGALSRLFWPTLPPPTVRVPSSSAVRWLQAAAVGSFVVALAFVGWRWGWRPPSSWNPMSPQVVAAIRRCPDRIFNHYNDGGYLIWFVPERNVFIDSRQDPFTTELSNAFLHAEHTARYSDLLGRYSVRCAVLRPGSRAAEVLRANNRIEYRDADWEVISFTDPR